MYQIWIACFLIIFVIVGMAGRSRRNYYNGRRRHYHDDYSRHRRRRYYDDDYDDEYREYENRYEQDDDNTGQWVFIIFLIIGSIFITSKLQRTSSNQDDIHSKAPSTSQKPVEERKHKLEDRYVPNADDWYKKEPNE